MNMLRCCSGILMIAIKTHLRRCFDLQKGPGYHSGPLHLPSGMQEAMPLPGWPNAAAPAEMAARLHRILCSF